MNRQQKRIVTNFVTVIVLTIAAVIAMIHLKDWVNRSEATKAMNQLSQEIGRYRKANGTVPPESYIDTIKKTLQGHARFGGFQYRARWIDFGTSNDEILAYIEQGYHTFIFRKTVLVLRLGGTVEWIDKREFENLLAKQQTPLEKMETSLK
jgi:hypothetical protein